MKYALAVLGLVAVVATIAAWLVNFKVAVFGAVIILILMVAVLVFARLTAIGAGFFLLPALILLYTFVLLTTATGVLLFTAAAFKWPPALHELIFGRAQVTTVADWEARPTQVEPEDGQTSTVNMSSDTWPETGDSQIDAVHKQLNSFAGQSITEAQLADILRQLFYRSVFRHIQEERDNASLLFALHRTELLLIHYVSWFRSSPVRQNINDARTSLIKLQQQIEALYGPNFSYSHHGEQYGASRNEYMSQIPPILTQRDPAFITQANQTLRELQNYLEAAHLWN